MLLCFGLAACGGGGGSDSGGVVSGSFASGQTSFSLRLTDAPVSTVARIVVQFTEVRIKPENGAWIDIALASPRAIDLLQLQGTSTVDLVPDLPVEAGNYTEVRLLVDSAPMTSFVELIAGGVMPLTIPSGSSSGLKLKGDFMLSPGRATTMIADFDLLQSLKINGGGNYRLDPVIRLINAADAGHIRGMVDPTLLLDPSCSDFDVNSHNSVYVFAGHNANVEDIDLDPGGGPDEATPVTTASIQLDIATGKYLYEAAYLPAGDYTIALTCNADAEDLDSDADDLKFFNIQNVSVLISSTIFLKSPS